MLNRFKISPAKSDFAILLSGRIVTALITFAGISVATRLLSPTQYGLYSIVIVLQGLSVLFIVSPFGQYVNRHLHEWQYDKSLRSKLTQYNQVVFLASFIGSLLAVIWALNENLVPSRIVSIAVCTGTLIISSTWSASYISYLNLLGMRKPSVAVSITGLASGLIFSFVFTYVSNSALGWLSGLISGQIIASILGRKLFKNIAPAFDSSHTNTFLTSDIIQRYILPLALATFFMWWLTAGYRLVLNALWGPAVLGAFAAGYAIAAGIVSSIEALLTQYMLPCLFRSLAHTDRGSHSAIYSEYLSLSVPFYLCSCSAILLILPALINSAVPHAYNNVVFFAFIGLAVETIKSIVNAFSIANQITVSTANLVPSYVIASMLTGSAFFALRGFFPGDLVISLSVVIGYIVLLLLVVRSSMRELPFTLNKNLLILSILLLLGSAFLASILYDTQHISSLSAKLASFIGIFGFSIVIIKYFLNVYHSCEFLSDYHR